MKNIITLLILATLLFTNNAFAGCVPVTDQYVNSDVQVSCRWNSGFGHVTENRYYAVRWSDNAETTSGTGDFRGYGECYGSFAEGVFRCDPSYIDKRYDDNGAYGRFNVLIEHKRFQTGSNRNCTEESRVWKWVNHTCNYGGGGGGECLGVSSSENPSSEKSSADEPTDNLMPEEPCGGGNCGLCTQNGGFCDQSGTCIGGSPSPILIDISGNGFDLTNAAGGVLFDIDVDNVKEQISWTTADTDDAWLAFDRDANGTIDSGKELFGNYTPQPLTAQGEERNGFRALAEYDKPVYGGNNDNQIDAGDAIFAQLKLWQDHNHNGISEPGELQNLFASPIRVIELRYRESRRTDEHGNKFKYRAKVKDARGAQVGRWAWDVFLVTNP